MFNRFAIKVFVTGLIFLSSSQLLFPQTIDQRNYLSIDSGGHNARSIKGNDNLVIHLDNQVFSTREKVIFSIDSRNLEINNFRFRTPAIRYQSLSCQSYTKPGNYNPPNPGSRIPDLRQVLLWDPEIILHHNEKHKIEFYTSDLQGKYRISIHGISSYGYPLNGSAIIMVKYKSD